MSKRRSDKFPHRAPGFIGPQEHPVKRTKRISQKSTRKYQKDKAGIIAIRKRESYRLKLTGAPSSPTFRKLNFNTMTNKEFKAMEQDERDNRKQELEQYRNKPVWKPKRST